MNTPITTIRLDAPTFARLDAARAPNADGKTPPRSEIIRKALAIGLAAIERERVDAGGAAS